MHATHFCMTVVKESVADFFHLHILLALSYIFLQFGFFYYWDTLFPYFKHSQYFCSSDDKVADDLDIGGIEHCGRFWERVDGRRGEVWEEEGVVYGGRGEKGLVESVHGDGILLCRSCEYL